jgi:transposase
MFNLTYKYRLKLNRQQEQTYSEWLETSRRVWNYALAERKDLVSLPELPHQRLLPAFGVYHSGRCRTDSF